jgi:hypothetical protein
MVTNATLFGGVFPALRVARAWAAHAAATVTSVNGGTI